MLEARSLTRKYGDFTAVSDISFSINEGEIVGMLGPNGAGKTTTLRMLTGFLPPTSGTVRIADIDIFENPKEAKKQIGYLPENVALYPEMRVEEYLYMRARLEGIRKSERKKMINSAIEECLIEDVRHQIIRTLSKGYKQRVALAATLLHKPKVLILDEPTVGLDPGQIIAIRKLIKELGKERTLILSTHILPEVELICKKVIIIDKGKKIAEGTLDDLAKQLKGEETLIVQFKEKVKEETINELSQAVKAKNVYLDNGTIKLLVKEQDKARETIFNFAVAKNLTLLELSAEKKSLEDIFVRLTTQENLELEEEKQ